MKALAELGDRAVVYGSCAMNCYLPPQFKFQAQDIDAFILCATANEFQIKIAVLKQRIEHLLTSMSEGVVPHLSFAMKARPSTETSPIEHITFTLSLNHRQVADFTRQLLGEVDTFRAVFPANITSVVCPIYGTFPVYVMSLDEVKHRLVATINSLTYVDGSDALPYESNDWRIKKDAPRLQRLLELEALGLISPVPVAFELLERPTAFRTVTLRHPSGLEYCMPAPFQAQRQSFDPSSCIAKVEMSTDSTLADAVSRLGAFDTRLSGLSDKLAMIRDHSSVTSSGSRAKIVAHAQMCAKLRSNHRSLRSRTMKHFQSWADDFGKYESKLLAAVKTFAARSQKVVSRGVSLMDTIRNNKASLREAHDMLGCLEELSYREHFDRLTFQKTVVECVSVSERMLSSYMSQTDQYRLPDILADAFQIQLRRFVTMNVFPPSMLDLLSFTNDYDEAVTGCLLSLFQQACTISVGGRDDVSSVPMAVLCDLTVATREKVVFLEGYQEDVDVFTRRDVQLHAIASTATAFILSPLLQRLKDMSETFELVIKHYKSGMHSIRDALVEEKLCGKHIKKSHELRSRLAKMF